MDITTSRYGELETDPHRRDSLGVVMRNWHPGPMGFQLTSDAFTYAYTKALLQALDWIEEDFKRGTDPRETWSASKRPLLKKGDLPVPHNCQEYCLVDHAPACLNFELPTFGNSGGIQVMDPEDASNPHKGEPQKWFLQQNKNDLWYMVDKGDIEFFRNREDKEVCRHLDKCGAIHAKAADAGTVVFRLPKMEVVLVVICGIAGQKGIVASQHFFIWNADLEITLNSVPVERSAMDAWPNNKCVRLQQRFPTSSPRTDNNYLALKVLRDIAVEVSISHVITL